MRTIRGLRSVWHDDGSVTTEWIERPAPPPSKFPGLPPEEAAKLLPPHPMLLLNAKSDSHEEMMKMQPTGVELARIKDRFRRKAGVE